MNYLKLKTAIVFSLCITTFGLQAEEEMGLVIVEKPDSIIEYQIDEENIHRGSPVLKKFGKFWAFSYMKKEFTNVTSGSDNIPSTFIGVMHGYEYNWSHLSIMADLGLYHGSKDSPLSGEEGSGAAAEALVDSLKDQVVVDIGFNLVLNSFNSWYIRPYVGAGAYVNMYKYLQEGDSTKTETYNIKSSFVRAGFFIDLRDADPSAIANLWRDFGVSRSSLILEAKQYSVVDAANTSKPEVYAGFMFEY
jgi:hypothetical protein